MQNEKKQMNTCPTMVSQGTWWSRYEPCGKKAGHGRDGLYCKTHAKNDPDLSAPTRTVYRWEKGKIIKLAVVSETEKQWRIRYKTWSGDREIEATTPKQVSDSDDFQKVKAFALEQVSGRITDLTRQMMAAQDKYDALLRMEESDVE